LNIIQKEIQCQLQSCPWLQNQNSTKNWTRSNISIKRKYLNIHWRIFHWQIVRDRISHGSYKSITWSIGRSEMFKFDICVLAPRKKLNFENLVKSKNEKLMK
jgi:hypothetical protein